MSTQNSNDRLNELLEKERKLSDRLIVHKANHARAVEDLKKAELEANNIFGTSDIDELRSLYKKINDENNQSLKTFEENLSVLEQELNNIDFLLSQNGLN